MDIKELKNKGLNHEYEITVPAKDVDSRVSSRLSQIGKQVKIAGFRPGKVPPRVLEQRYGQAAMGEVLEQLVNESVGSLFEEKKIRPALQPQIEVKSYDRKKGLEFILKAEILPEVSHMDYAKLSLVKKVAKINDSEIKESLENIASSHSASEPIKTKRAAKEGDIAVIDFVGRVDGTEFAGGKGEAYPLELGSHMFIPGFEEQVVGHKPDETFDVNVTFPKEYGAKELAGKDAVFEVSLKEIQKKVPAKVDDELAKKLGLEDAKALKVAVKEQHEKQYDGLSRNHLKRELLDALDEEYRFDIPQGLVDQELNNIVQQWQHQKDNNPEALGDEANATEEDIRSEYQKIAERRVRLGLVLTDLGRQENIKVTDEDRQQVLMREVQRFPGQEQQIFDYFQKNPQALAALEAPVLEERVIDLIISKAKVKEETVSVEDLMKELEEDEAPKKKPAAKKAPAKKAEPKKATEKKPAAKKAPAKKAEHKKAAEKKPAAKKATTKKTTAKSLLLKSNLIIFINQFNMFSQTVILDGLAIFYKRIKAL
ncbi:MAG: trigger factor [Alphaproteobacteria bacterium]